MKRTGFGGGGEATGRRRLDLIGLDSIDSTRNEDANRVERDARCRRMNTSSCSRNGTGSDLDHGGADAEEGGARAA